MATEQELEEYRQRWVNAQAPISVKIHPVPTAVTVSRDDMARILQLRTIPIPEMVDEILEKRGNK